MSQSLDENEPLPWDDVESENLDPGVRLRRKLKATLLRHYMQDGKTIQHLISLDISDESLAALSMIPLVEVAWADGTIKKTRLSRQRESSRQTMTREPASYSITG